MKKKKLKNNDKYVKVLKKYWELIKEKKFLKRQPRICGKTSMTQEVEELPMNFVLFHCLTLS